MKETARDEYRNVIYTVEALDFQDGPSAARWVASGADADGIDAKAILSAEGVMNIARQVDEFNTAHKVLAALESQSLTRAGSRFCKRAAG